MEYYKYPNANANLLASSYRSPGIVICNHANGKAKLLSRNINLSSVTPNLAEWNYILYSWIEEDLKTNDCYQISKEEAFIEVL